MSRCYPSKNQLFQPLPSNHTHLQVSKSTSSTLSLKVSKSSVSIKGLDMWHPLPTTKMCV